MTKLHLQYQCQKVQVHGTIQERLSIEPHEILLNGIPLERESKFKYLGIHISANPSWSSQFCTICKKATRLIGMPYRRFYASADIQTCILLHVSYVWPHLEYMHRCMPGMGSSSQKGYWSTGVSSEIFTESVYQTIWDTPNLTLLNSFHLPKLTDRRQYVKLCTMYKIIHGLVDFPNSPTHFGSNAKTDGFKYAFFFHQRLLYGTLFLQIWCVGLTITSRNLVINMYCSFHV